jgi:hypothetical protein
LHFNVRRSGVLFTPAMLARIVHDDRVRDAREAAALIRALGVTRVRLTQHHARAWVLDDKPAIARVIAAIEPDSRSEITFEGITREATAPLLAALVAADAHFISIAGNGATLRVWPRREESGAGQAFVDERALGRATVFERFRDACAVTWINASTSQPGADALAALAGVLAELDQPEIEVDFEVTLDNALALATEFPAAALEWAGGGVVVQLPAGELATYCMEPVPPDFTADWRVRISEALARVRAGATPQLSP